MIISEVLRNYLAGALVTVTKGTQKGKEGWGSHVFALRHLIKDYTRHIQYYCICESSISGKAAGPSGSKATMQTFDPRTYPRHIKEALRVSTQLFCCCAFDRLLLHQPNSEVPTGVTYSIISSIKVQFNAPRGDIPSGQ